MSIFVKICADFLQEDTVTFINPVSNYELGPKEEENLDD